MGSCNDEIGQTLPQRLLAHAALHDSLVEFDHCEQRRWADDLREAAAEIERLRAEAAVLRDANARWPAAVAAERERCVNETLDALSNQVAFWLANRYHEMPSIQRQIDRENELIEDGVSSAVESVRRRILGPNVGIEPPRSGRLE